MGRAGWLLSELARHLKTSASGLQRELAALSEAEILLHRPDGNRVYYRANPECPLFPELQGLIVEATGLVGVLHDALQPLAKGIRVAFVYGSVTRHEEGATSDVDLLVVGMAADCEVGVGLIARFGTGEAPRGMATSWISVSRYAIPPATNHHPSPPLTFSNHTFSSARRRGNSQPLLGAKRA